MREYYDRIAIAYIHDLHIYGTVEKLGVYASVVKYKLEDKEIEESCERMCGFTRLQLIFAIF